MQEKIQAVAPTSQQTKSPAPTPSAPMPLDPALLRQISGGTDSTGLPNKGW